jgi:AcrR family transcriptional regulator
LLAAAQLATVEGLDGLSIGRLAEETGMSKSGLYAHFGSKQELELAAIGTAAEIFESDVVRPGLAAPAGVRRIEALCNSFLSHVERRVFPGGCFFASAAAELDTRPGPVRERIAGFQRGWQELLQRLVREAQELGELGSDLDPAQVAFELNAMLGAANGIFVLQGDEDVLERARAGVRARLGTS